MEMLEELQQNGTFIAQLPAKRDPLYVVVPMTILYSLIFVTGVVGNISTCIVIARNRHMHTATNYYLFSLAVSDLLLLISGLPQEMYYIWSRYPYVFGSVFCVLRGLAAETSANATVLTITAFTVERYVAICHPFLAHTLSKLSRAVKFIMLIWIVSIASAAPQAFQFDVVVRDGLAKELGATCMLTRVIIDHAFELSTLIFFVAPMTIIIVLYVLIGLRLRRSAKLTRNSGSFSHSEKSRKGSSRHHSSQRVVKMLIAVVVAFAICWAPFHAQRLLAIYAPENLSAYSVVTYISGTLYYMSTTVNPILYHIMSLKFREAFKGTFAKCCLSKRRTRPYLILSRGRTDPECSKSVTDSASANASKSSIIKSKSKSDDRNRSEICQDCLHEISNSSLRDVDKSALEDELTAYMNELALRQTS